jgi:hypothetical protein
MSGREGAAKMWEGSATKLDVREVDCVPDVAEEEVEATAGFLGQYVSGRCTASWAAAVACVDLVVESKRVLLLMTEEAMSSCARLSIG